LTIRGPRPKLIGINFFDPKIGHPRIFNTDAYFDVLSLWQRDSRMANIEIKKNNSGKDRGWSIGIASFCFIAHHISSAQQREKYIS